MKFQLKELLERHDSARLLTASGRLRDDHPEIIADPVLHIRLQNGMKISMLQSELIARQNADRDQNAPAGKRRQPPSTGPAPITTITPAQPSDAGLIADFSAAPYMVLPMRGDQGTQWDIADCYYLAVLASLAKQRQQVVTTIGKQLASGKYRTRFYHFPNYPSTTGQTGTDVITDDIMATQHARLADDGSKWGMCFERAYAYARTGANTYASLNWGWAAGTMMDLGIMPTSYSITGPSITTTMMSALTNSPCVVAQTKPTVTVPGIIDSHVYSSHVYSISAVRPNADAALTEIDVDNPWKNYGITTLKLPDFQAAFSVLTVGTAITFVLDPEAGLTIPANSPLLGTLENASNAMTSAAAAMAQAIATLRS